MAITIDQAEARIIALEANLTALQTTVGTNRTQAAAAITDVRAKLRRLWDGVRDLSVPGEDTDDVVNLQAPLSDDELREIRWLLQERRKVRQ
jgi:hypothetical protein